MICFQEDEYTREKWESEIRWTVELSDGRRVIQDDGRPGLSEPSAWLRLKVYLWETGLRIRRMWLSFRDHEEFPLPDNAEAYFFRKSLVGLDSGDNFHFYIVGILKDGIVHTQMWKVPELFLMGTDQRDPSNKELVGDCLI